MVSKEEGINIPAFSGRKRQQISVDIFVYLVSTRAKSMKR